MMKLVLIVFLTFSCVFAFENSDEFINEINSKQNLWKAGRNFPKDTPASRIQGLLGTIRLPKDALKNIPVMKHKINASVDIPESFDSRTRWSNCKNIKQIADQSACGSCWAVSVASVIGDRICIHSDGKKQPEISAKNLLTCETDWSHGCKGGNPSKAFEYWKTTGVVTGGLYGSKIGCQPYPFPQCEHHINGSKPNCPTENYDTPKCVKTCDDPTIKFEEDLIRGESVYEIDGEEQIQLEILKNGPIVATFDVFEDFLHYKSGVYIKTTEVWKGMHAVRVLGWGVENGTKYWLVANSWNEDWGDKGLFKIRRGTDECYIEVLTLAGLPK